jgi:hypothetical protein
LRAKGKVDVKKRIPLVLSTNKSCYDKRFPVEHIFRKKKIYRTTV